MIIEWWMILALNYAFCLEFWRVFASKEKLKSILLWILLMGFNNIAYYYNRLIYTKVNLENSKDKS